ncbi:DUF2470 domain-containing protein [Micromonospora sp. NPDC000207]|uniref:DUF2470 domain-containing protein n=1 Tax=Micromonospora sp. NPDC000207 TaxID=3154246 RepID=UPI00332B70D2
MALDAEQSSLLADVGQAADAVRVRSVLTVATSLRLRVADTDTDLMDAHATLPDGTVVVAADAMTPLGGLLVAARGADGAVQLDVTDLVPVPVRARVRAWMTLTGRVDRFDPETLDTCDHDAVVALLGLPPVALWAIRPDTVRIRRHEATVQVPIAAYHAARPDPVAAVEAAHLARLIRNHPRLHRRIAATVDSDLIVSGTRVVPVALDAEGLTIRAETGHRHHDVRLPFAGRVTDEATLDRELHRLAADDGPSRHPGEQA